ncbi:hypothetical protein M9Y10_001952 [Tritrichomonas musculus]|uniref:Putative nitroreductase TM1586 domain-containing protein n=1 Tax=Tritrichomonas musculus TaxID=1915356 RepID=A0ABR2L8F3_9EUKA
MSQEPLPISEAIKQRHSVRTFKGLLSDEQHSIVLKIIDEANSLPAPFGTNATVGDSEPGLGRMGVISNEAGWLLGKIPSDTPEGDLLKARYDVSYKLQVCVLKMFQNGLANVWIGGTYNEKLAEERNPGFTIPIVIAYGEDAKTTRFIESAMKFMVGAKGRYPLEKMFYDLDNKRPFTTENAGEHLELLQAVQSCPSALNIQSWRLVITGNIAHLYKASTHAACDFDMGIAIATISLLLESHGHKTQITFVENPPENPLDGGTYICTMTLKD